MLSLLVPTLTAAWLAANPPVASAKAGQPIYGGDPVEVGGWPAVVGVYTGKLCTGTLVAPDLVLTAAHCFDPEPSGSVLIYLGNDIYAPQATIASDDWGRHPDFCLPADCGEDLSDFAWIRLPNPVAIDPIVPVRDQAEFDEVMRVGQPLMFVGFGEDEDGENGVKREVQATLTSFNESGREFDAGGDGNDTCSGDSGGPALARLSTGEWRLVGVISRGGTCGEGGIYGVPNPELCWLRDSSGVDLLAAGCEACDCIVLHGAEPDGGCACEIERTDGGWVAVGLLFGVVVLLGRSRRRTASLLVLGLLWACASEGVEPNEPSQRPTPEPKPLAKPDPTPVVDPTAEPRVTISSAEAAAAGLAKLGFSIDTSGSGMSLTKLGDGAYIDGSGPPGGVLSLTIRPTTIGADLSGIAAEASVVAEPIELLGASRTAVAWISGESMGRSSHCAVIVGKPGALAGDPALLIELAVGYSGDAVECATTTSHHVLGPILESLRFEP